MEAPFLGLMIVLSLGLAGVLEALAQVSSRSGGGLALARSEAEVPRAVRLAYLYLPTTVAVAYGLLWTCAGCSRGWRCRGPAGPAGTSRCCSTTRLTPCCCCPSARAGVATGR